MFLKIKKCQRQFLKTCIRNFGYLQKQDATKIKDEYQKLQNLEDKIQKSHDPVTFKVFNSKKFLDFLKRMEIQEKKNYMGFDIKQYSKNMQFAIILILCFLLIHYIWKTVPFTVIFKHFTINEYTTQKKYLHNILISCLSIRENKDIIIYLTPLIFALSLLGKNFNSNQLFLLFFANTIISGTFGLFVEKYRLENKELLMPKIQGNTNCVFSLSLLTSVRYDVKIFNKFFPLWTITLFYGLYEINQIIQQNQQSKDQNIMSHYGSILSIINGLFFGFMCRKYLNLQALQLTQQL